MPNCNRLKLILEEFMLLVSKLLVRMTPQNTTGPKILIPLKDKFKA